MTKRTIVIAALAAALLTWVALVPRPSTRGEALSALPQSETVRADVPADTARPPRLAEETRRELPAPDRSHPRPPTTLTVLVTSEETGAPLAGVRALVTARLRGFAVEHRDESRGPMSVALLSDREGRVVFDVEAGAGLQVDLWHEGRGHRRLEEEIEPLALGEQREVRLHLPVHDERNIALELVHGLTGEPLRGLEVEASPPGGTFPLFRSTSPYSGLSDAEGRLALPESIGSSFELRAEGFDPVRTHGVEPNERPLRVLLDPEASLSGRIHGPPPTEAYFVVAKDASRMAEEQLAMVGPDWADYEGCYRRTPVASNGSFELRGVETSRSWRIEVHDGGQRLQRLPGLVRLRPGERREIDWSIAGCRVSGTAVGAQGEPMAGHEVWLLPAAELPGRFFAPWYPPHDRTQTDEAGGFAFELVPPGDWLVGASARYRGIAACGEPVSVPLGGEEVWVDLVMHRGLSIEGRVLNASGEPLGSKPQHVTIICLPSGRPDDLADTTGLIGDDGSFSISPLVPGRYTLRLSLHGVESEAVEAEAGDRDVALRLDPLGEMAEIAGEVRGGALLDAPYGLLLFGVESMRVGGYADASFQWKIPAGTYSIVARSPDGRIATRSVSVAPGESLSGLELELAPGASVRLAHRRAWERYRIRSGGLVVERGQAPGGLSPPTAVPPGRVQVDLRGDDGEWREAAAVELAAGELRVVEL